MKTLIAGKWIEDRPQLAVVDPFDGSVVDSVPLASLSDVEAALSGAADGAKEMAALPAFRRAEILLGAAQGLAAGLEEVAQLIARESSKTIREARKEATRAVNTLTLSGEEAKRLTGDTVPFSSFPGGEDRRGYVALEPVGIVAAITPFNDPLNLVAHKLGPAIAAGNAVVLKPSSETPLSAIRLVEILHEAGLPDCAVSVLIGSGAEIGEPLVRDPRVRLVSFTGGVSTGRRITQVAGIKRLGMELGSNSPVVVWRDADLERAVDLCVSGAFWAAGQNCIGVQRILVHDEHLDAFRSDFVAKTEAYRVGDKMDEETDMGPMITEGEAARVESWVCEAVGRGAELHSGGGREGTLMQPTVLSGADRDVSAYCQEVFGPLVHIDPIATLDEAIAECNRFPLGLHAAVFTQDVDTAFRAAEGLRCGGVMINDSTDYRLDSMPFGGVGESGLGREGVRSALHEMTEPKVVCFNLRSA